MLAGGVRSDRSQPQEISCGDMPAFMAFILPSLTTSAILTPRPSLKSGQ